MITSRQSGSLILCYWWRREFANYARLHRGRIPCISCIVCIPTCLVDERPNVINTLVLWYGMRLLLPIFTYPACLPQAIVIVKTGSVLYLFVQYTSAASLPSRGDVAYVMFSLIGWDRYQIAKISIHYSDVIMNAMAFQISGVSIVCLTLCSDAVQRIHQSSASLAFVRVSTGDCWIPLTNGQ